MSAEQRIFELGISLPMGSAPAGNYVSAVQSGNLLFISGRAPLSIDGRAPKGQLGREFSTHDGYDLARSACIAMRAAYCAKLGFDFSATRPLLLPVRGSLALAKLP